MWDIDKENGITLAVENMNFAQQGVLSVLCVFLLSPMFACLGAIATRLKSSRGETCSLFAGTVSCILSGAFSVLFWVFTVAFGVSLVMIRRDFIHDANRHSGAFEEGPIVTVEVG